MSMSLPDENARRLLRALEGLETAGAHEAWLAGLPDYVEAELAGEDAARLYADLHAHLDRCEACSLVYAELLDWALAEAAGKLPVIETLPPVRLPPPARQAAARQRADAARVAAERRSRRAPDRAHRRFVEALATATGPLEPAAAVHVFGLGPADTPAVRLVLAGYYALEAAARQAAAGDWPAEVKVEVRKRLEAAALTEARRMKLSADESAAFVAAFGLVVLEELDQFLD